MEREQAERSGIRTSSSTDSDTDTETVSEADLCCNSEDPESDPEHVEPRRCGALLTLHEQKGKQESENDSTEDRMRNKDKEHEVDEEEDEMSAHSNCERCVSHSVLKKSRKRNFQDKRYPILRSDSPSHTELGLTGSRRLSGVFVELQKLLALSPTQAVGHGRWETRDGVEFVTFFEKRGLDGNGTEVIDEVTQMFDESLYHTRCIFRP
ncbi:hypothetical protein C0J50_0348 [Silurus asotus]|uniref:Uncharacterized protein n=1 Tax=Silurus asotus TaxID=30991 RepID=A0AAD5AHH2_SILAS|nr:hypothetical protein C0J50_0348 [Silurus asotus]